QKRAEQFLFFRIVDGAGFKGIVRQYVVDELTSTFRARERERIIADRQQMREPPDEGWLGSGLGFTGRGMSRLLGPRRPRMEAAFERGAESPETIELLNDPPLRNWLEGFRSDRIDGVFLITGPNAYSVTSRGNSLRQLFGPTIELMYS